jgi:putative endonuclease
VLYTGVTNDLLRRMHEHRSGTADSFTKRYSISKLVYYEFYASINQAIYREKQIKGFRRSKKNDLIYSQNTEWSDLYDEL